MFQAGDTVLYGADGVCKISEIAEKEFRGETKQYYVLKPVHQAGSTYYLPTDSSAVEKLKRVLSVEEIHELIRTMPDEEVVWVEDEDTRKQMYKEILLSGDRRRLVKLIKALYLHREELRESGRKFHIADERAMKDAEKLLYDEFAHVLKIEEDQVLPFIMEQIELEEKRRNIWDSDL